MSKYSTQPITTTSPPETSTAKPVEKPQSSTSNVEVVYKQFMAVLQHAKYKVHHIDELQAKQGHPSVYLPVFHYLLLIYSKYVSRYIEEKGFVMKQQNDYTFMNNAFTFLQTHFHYTSQISLQDYFRNEYGPQKMKMVIDLIHLIKKKHAVLAP